MRYTFKHASKVTPDEERVVKRLKIEMGTIWDDFIENRSRKQCYVTLVRDEKTIVAWGLLFWDRHKSEWDFSVYVKSKWRRRGIGTRIYNKMKKRMNLKNDQIEVHRHNTGSMLFFNKLQV